MQKQPFVCRLQIIVNAYSVQQAVNQVTNALSEITNAVDILKVQPDLIEPPESHADVHWEYNNYPGHVL